MSFQWDNYDNQWKYTNVDGITLQDLINEISVDGTGDVSDLNLPTTGFFNADEYFNTSTAVESGGGGEPLFTLTELKNVGFTVPEVKNYFEIAELQSVGYSKTQIGNGGYTITELKTKGFTANDIIYETNFTANDLEEEGFKLNQPEHSTTTINKYSTITFSNDIAKIINIDNELFFIDNISNKISKIKDNNDNTINHNENFISGLNQAKDIIKHNNKYYITNSGTNSIISADISGTLNNYPIVGTENESGDINGINKIVNENDTVNINASYQNTKLNNPQEIFVDNSGNISFYDKNNSVIKSFDISNNEGLEYKINDIFYIANTESHIISRLIDGYVSTWIGKKNESGDVDGDYITTRLNKPVALKSIIEDNVEHIYFLDKGNGKLKHFTKEDLNVTTIVSGLSSPEGFTKYENDYYICDTGNNKIVKFGENTGANDFVTNINSPKDIISINNEIEGDHFIVTCGNHTIVKILLNKNKFTISGIEDISGNINGVDERVTSGFISGLNSNSRYNSPTSIIKDNSDNILFVDVNNNIIRKLESNGNDSETQIGIHYIVQENGKILKHYNTSKAVLDFIDGFDNISKIDRIDDDLFIIERNTNSLKKINLDGEINTIYNEFNNPNGFLIEGNDFYIADTDNDRIVKLTRDPLIERPGPIIFDSDITEIGFNINGEQANEKFGYAISYNYNGTLLAISSTKNNGNGSTQGMVRIFEWRIFSQNDEDNNIYHYTSTIQDNTQKKPLIITSDNSTAPIVGEHYWTQKGFDIDGEADSDESGQDIKLNKEGNIIAISSIGNDPNGNSKAGHVRIYEWKQFTQDDEDNDNYHYSSRLRNSELESSGGVTQGKPIIITSSLTTEPVVDEYYWIQKGKDINGSKSFDRSGFSIAMNTEGNKLAVGEPYFDPIDDFGTKLTQGGRVRIYHYENDNWNMLGNELTGEESSDYFGYSVDFDEMANKIAIGAYRGLDNDGYVKVYNYEADSNAWNIIGSKIIGDSGSNQRFGSSISLNSEGEMIIIGAPNHNTNSGIAKVYKFNVQNNDWEQHGSNILGSPNDYIGYKVSINWNGKVIAISGNKHNSGAEIDNGIVKMFNYSLATQDWIQIFNDIIGGNGDEMGSSIELTKEGNKIAISSPLGNSDTSFKGFVKVYKFGEIDGISYKNPTYTKTIFKDNIEKPLDIIKDNSNNFYVSQEGHTITRIDISNNILTIAGVKDNSDNVTGKNTITYVNHFNNETLFVRNEINTRFNKPNLLLSEGNSFFVTDVENNSIKKIDISNNTYQSTGSLFVSEHGSHTIKKIDLDGLVIDYAGVKDISGTTLGGLGTNKFNAPKGIVQDHSRNLLVVDSANNRVKKIDRITGVTSVIANGFNNPTDLVHIGTQQETIRVMLPETIFNPATQLGNTIGKDDIGVDGVVRFDVNNDGTIVVVGVDTGGSNDILKVFKYNDTNNTWEQLGQDFAPWSTSKGRSVSINGRGNIIANSSQTNPHGLVDIWQYSTPGQTGGTWLMFDANIDKNADNDGNGFSIALNDSGDTIIVGAPGSDISGNNSGLARVFKLPVFTDSFIKSLVDSGEEYAGPEETYPILQLGQNIVGKSVSDFMGHGVRLSSDGNIAAISGPQSGVGSGVVRVYQYSTPGQVGGIWEQLGEDIVGENSNDSSGSNDSISLTKDGKTIAIGAVDNNYNPTDNPEGIPGHVRIYEWNETEWIQKGFDINGEYIEDQTGWSVSLNNDGSVLAISSINNTGLTNVTESGHVRIYKWKQYTQEDQDNLTYHYTSYTQDQTQTKLLIITENLTTAPIIGEYYWSQMVLDIDGNFENHKNGYRVKLDENGEKVGISSSSSSSLNIGLEIYKVREGGFETDKDLIYDELLISDTDNHKIKKIVTKEPVEVTDYIGSGVEGNFDGVGVLAELSKPEGLLLDSSGNLFIADSGTHCIRKADSDLNVITEAGLPTISGQENGQGFNSKFNEPNNMIMIDNTLYISDSKNHTVRKGIIEYNEGGEFAEIPIQTLRASDEQENLFFGSAISFNDKFLLISAKHIDNKGKVYLYKLIGDQWQEIITIQPDDLEENDEFGKTLLIYNNFAFIGCENKFSKKGLVYVYEKEPLDDTVWDLLQIIQASDGDENHLFGKSIAAFNDNLLIGAPMDESINSSGKVYQFLLNDPNGITGYWGSNNNGIWNETNILTPNNSDSDVNDQFGCSISIGNNLAVIGANKKNKNTSKVNTGYVYLFVKNSLNEWLESSPGPISDEAMANDEYGISVLLNKELTIDELNKQQIVIGAWKKDDPLDSGRVYIYNLAEASSGSITIGYNPRSGEWGTLVLPKSLQLDPNMDTQPGDSLIYNGKEWTNTDYDWKIVYENQTINVTETELDKTGTWNNTIIQNISI